MRAASPADRIERELEHHRRIAPLAEQVWNWDSPTGRRRAKRRAEMFVAQARLGPGRRALELGCGTALFLEQAARSGAEVWGMDLTPELLAQARERLAGFGSVRLLRGDAQNLPFPDASFDAVYGSSILHHLTLEPALAEVRRVLRPGGRAVFAEPNLLNPHIAFTFLVGPRKLFGLTPDEMAFTRFRARQALERAGFAAVSVTPFDFLHPLVPRPLVGAVFRLGAVLERIPGLREIAGSLLLHATRP